MKIFYSFIAALLALTVFSSCHKVNLAEIKSTGEGIDITSFRLLTPGNPDSIYLNAATPSQTIDFTWGQAHKGVEAPIAYTWVLTLKSDTGFSNPILKVVSDDNGASPKAAVSYKKIDDALKNAGIANGGKAELLWSVIADNGDTKIMPLYANSYTITRMKDGASPFYLLNPVSSTAATVIDPTLTTSNLVFNWTKSHPVSGGAAITYKILFAQRKTDDNGNILPIDWTNPLFSFKANNNGSDSVATITYKSISDSLTQHGLTNVSDIDSLRWTVVATSGTWNQYSDYVNDISIQRQVITYLYVPGDYQGWDLGSAPKLASTDGMNYEGYIWVPAGGTGEFKINTAPDWNHPSYSGTSTPTGGILDASAPGNLNWPELGVYFLVKVNLDTKEWTVTKTDWGVIGDATPGGWDNSTPMTYDPSTGKWKATVTMTAGSFKFRANNAWDINLGGSATYLSYGGDNISTAAGTKTVILDLTTPLKYTYTIQ